MPKIVEDGQVYRAVIQVIAAHGYSGATTREMAETAGVSEVTLFRKYESKARLVQLAIEHIIAQTDFSAAARYTGDVRADLLRVVRAYQESAVRHNFFFSALFADLSRHPELVETLQAPLQIFSAIEKLVARYQEAGVLKPAPAAHLAAALLGPLIYTAMMQSGMPGFRQPLQDSESHTDRFLNGHQAAE